MKELNMKKIYKATLEEAKDIIGKTLLNDEEYFKKYFKDQKDQLEDHSYEELTRYFTIVYHAHYLENDLENGLNDYQKECKEKGIYANWNLNRTDVDISLPLLLELLDKAKVVYQKNDYYLGDRVVSPTRQVFNVDRYKTLENRMNEGLDKVSLSDLLDQSPSLEEFKNHSK